MTTLKHRDYAGEADRDAALHVWSAARADGAGDPWPSLDFLDAELGAQPAGTADVRLWEDAHGRLVGVALLLDECVLIWRTAPGAGDEALEAAMIAWGLARVRGTAHSSGECMPLFVPVCDEDRRLVALLERAGFQEDGLRTLRMACSLQSPIPLPAPPPGVSIRPAAGTDEIAAVTRLHAALFASGKTVGERLAVMRSSGYRPELDLIAVLADGTLAGYALGICAPLERWRLAQVSGWIEFVGVSTAHQRRGIGRALTHQLLHAMRALGLDTALLTTDATNRAAQHLFAGCGFRTRHEIRWYLYLTDSGGASRR